MKDTLSRSVEPAQARIRSSAAHGTDEDLTTVYLSRVRKASVLAASILAALVVETATDSTAEAAPGQAEPENNLSLENGIVFKAEGHRENEIAFDIREDIARAQEFLKDKVAGCSITKLEKKVTFFRKGRKKERLVRRTVVKPNSPPRGGGPEGKKDQAGAHHEPGYVTEGFHVTRIRNNGVASRFEVTYPENMASWPCGPRFTPATASRRSSILLTARRSTRRRCARQASTT